jgi:hypothetical protein
MILKHHRLTGFALALVIGALLAPAALAQPTDQVGPASLPASSPSPSATARPEVLPNPDNQEPAGASSATPTLPHGVGYSSYDVGRSSTPPSDIPAAPVASNPGFDWGDAGIGAGAAFALTIIGLGGVLVLNNRHHRAEQPAPTA